MLTFSASHPNSVNTCTRCYEYACNHNHRCDSDDSDNSDFWCRCSSGTRPSLIFEFGCQSERDQL